MKTFIFTALGAIALVGLYFGLFVVRQDATVRAQTADTQVFHTSQSYVDGKTQTIEKLRREYEHTSGTDREIIRGQILRETSTIDKTLLPPDTRSFVEAL